MMDTKGGRVSTSWFIVWRADHASQACPWAIRLTVFEHLRASENTLRLIFLSGGRRPPRGWTCGDGCGSVWSNTWQLRALSVAPESLHLGGETFAFCINVVSEELGRGSALTLICQT